MKLQLVTFLTFLVLGSALASKSFSKFQLDFNKKYSSPSELRYRQAIFHSNLRKIEEHNEKYAKGEVSWYMGVNQFTDMTQEEFESQLQGLPDVLPERDPENEAFSQKVIDELLQNQNNTDFQASFSWVDYGVVSSAKDQGACGSCAAFAATGAIESCFAIRSGGRPTDLSEQFLVDCARGYISGIWSAAGCRGGWPQTYYAYVKNKHSGRQQTERAYPYTASDGSCHANSNGYYTGGAVTNYVNRWLVTNENELLNMLTNYGPVATTLDASPIGSYAGGVFESNQCCNANFGIGCSLKNNHAVLVVGYGTENGKDYWLVKNSWGSWYGNNGYFKMKRGSGHCGFGYQSNTVPTC